MEALRKKYQLFWLNPKVVKVYAFFAEYIHIYCRFVIAAYFLNFAATEVQIWSYNDDGFPFATLLIVPCALLLMFNVQVKWTGYLLMGVAGFHSAQTIYDTLQMFRAGHGLYFNELMVKRLAMLGCLAMVLGRALLENDAKSKSTFAGLLLEDDRPSMARNRSGVLLVARLLISLLFIFVGYSEIKRQLVPIRHGNHVHTRPEGDGHDEIWAKTLQFAFALPLCVGVYTKPVARALGVCCLLEAFVCWRFWSTVAHSLGLGYAIHAREHFTVNVAVSGGCFLLQSFGAGKYSLDAYLKKQE